MPVSFTIYTDCHLGSPIEMLRNELLTLAYSEYTLLMGDNIDLANCKKKEVEIYRSLRLQLMRTHKSNYLDGNHERSGVGTLYIIKRVNDVGYMFAHGDMEADPERWTKYRRDSHGAGAFKRGVIVRFIKEAEEIIERTPPEKFLKRASEAAKLANCGVYVCGHFHVKEVIRLVYDGITIVILPRGKTVLTF